MSDDDLKWTAEPIRAQWSTVYKPRSWIRITGGRPVQGALGPTYRIEQCEIQRIEALQRDRARQLTAAMGFRTDVSDNHASRIVEVLSPFIPGLTIGAPREAVRVPDWLGARWAQPKVGARVKWSEERKRQLLADVERLKAEGLAASDRAALEAIKNATDGQGGPGVSVERLQNLLSEARKLPPPP